MKKEMLNELSGFSSQREEIIKRHRENGVIFVLDGTVFIGPEVKIEPMAVILPGSILTGSTVIAAGAHIGPYTLLHNASVGCGASLNCVQGYDCTVGQNADIGPYVHLRPGSKIDCDVHLGNFVEIKNSSIGSGTKVSHLTYVGDSDVGRQVNFGCGCVTVNYDGKLKHRTTVKDRAFIGCNTNLIAPVTVGEYGYTAAGSTVTEDVPDGSLAVARARQVNKIGWVQRKRPYKNMK